ncbi:MAG: right-handed parallel beta-helix repeat-containing protein [Maricaulis sp.]|uniref:parallel beta-helix domain-containing protein n=1 Tax=Maricaulis sp. TaxID=1486257 RepID=UPI001B0F486B|nr:parallel beta-helix domain-containing protein [Maricaulis sp.]MBO6729241.1 right-handed parallel beta-helix repeat-containing protein [Maricaulis sp.]MBO6848004.1 right-handed parallel beta-helix repeat-containing protein [Maricaulis sp.]MBO6878625.1 right-handed parallel beta-helix repeat-containing protein [Maricaulis sp.]
MKRFLLTGAMALALAACGNSGQDARDVSSADASYQDVLLEQLIDAQPGDVIEIPAGVYHFTSSLMLTVDGVTIRGAGMDETILNFQGQLAGAEGLLVTANDFTLENLAIEDTSGDALKVNGGTNVVIRGVRVEWTNGYSTDNGAYGIYPVQSENVLVEDTVAIGASDAGIYVGQSRNVTVRNSRAEYNVAGIEIENCIGADVYGNTAKNNTGGILVFNMPNLPQPGYQTRVYDNDVFENNTENFGHAGTPVASVPAGTGILINSNDHVEIFNNRISDNNTANVIISSLHTTGYADSAVQSDFDAYPEGIWIHDNIYSGGGNSPDGLDLNALKVMMFGLTGRLPDVLFDGYIDEAKFVDGEMPAELRICVSDDVDVLNADAPNGFSSPTVDTENYRCTLDPLPASHLNWLD